jgi:hypothetical protein
MDNPGQPYTGEANALFEDYFHRCACCKARELLTGGGAAGNGREPDPRARPRGTGSRPPA